MNLDESIKQAVFNAIKNGGNKCSFTDLEKTTKLSLKELSFVLGLLFKEERILIQINHSEEYSYQYQSSAKFLYARFMDLLSKHCGYERSATFYASQLCITPKYLTTIVKQQSGKPASEWIQEEAIKKIKQMLYTTQDSIKEIAYKLNFSNQSFFGKFFKEHTGMSPQYYRKVCISN